MTKVCQLRIYLSDRQKRLFDAQLECHRLLYNTVLDDAENLWNSQKKSEGTMTLVKKWVNHFRKNDNRFSDCNYSSLQHTVRRFGKTRDKIISTRKGKTRCSFRRKKGHDFNTLEYTYGDGLHIKNGKVKIHGLGFVKTVWHRTPEKPSYVTVSRKGTQYYVNFFQKTYNDAPIQCETAVGLDFGVQTLVAFSTGEKVAPPKYAKRDKKDLARAHRKVHKVAKGSQERARRRKVLNKINQRIANRRKDFNHQLSRSIVNRYDVICMEDLKVNGIVSDDPIAAKKANINRAVYDLGIGQLQNFLSYKAENAGRTLVKVNPAYTSQKCSCCGRTEAKTLDQRIHQCECGLTLDRDVNAALNILTLGLQSLGKLSLS